MARYGGLADQLSVGVWLIGLGILLATGRWWPGIMVVLGAATIVRGLAEGQGWQSLQGAFWIMGIGLWFALGTNLAGLLIVLGVGVVLTAFSPDVLGGQEADRPRSLE
jgi:hypothetical protein